jgi:thiol-disulfide isomerase/thioredoxin
LLLTAPLLFAATDTGSAESAAIANLRNRYRRMEYSRGVDEGKPLIVQFPASTELRAWYVSNLAHVDSHSAVRMARDLRYAHPDDAWSWFADANAHLYNDNDDDEARHSSEKMLSLYKGTDGEVFRLRCLILLDQFDYDTMAKFLADKTEPYALAQRASLMAQRASLDKTSIDERLAAYTAAERADPDDARVWHEHGMVLRNGNRLTDAMPILRHTVELAPDSVVARRDYWHILAAAGDAGPDAKKASVEADIDSFLAHHQGPDALYAAQQQLQDLEDDARATPLEQRLLVEFSESKEAGFILFNKVIRYRKQNSRKQSDPVVKARIRTQWREFIDYPFHPDESLLGTAYGSLLDSYRDDPVVPPELFLDLVDGLLAYGDGQRISSIAEQLATRGLRLSQAEQLARDGVRTALVRLEREKAGYTKEDYEKVANFQRGHAHLALGWVLLTRHRNTAAGTELKLAYSLLPNDPAATHHMGKWYEANGAPSKAEDAYGAGMAHERDDSGLNRVALRDLYLKRHGSEEGLESYVAAIREGASSKAKRVVLASRITPARAPRSPFSLKTLEGERISLASLKGKVAVVKFWGVWCAPCVSELPEFQKLVDKYGGDTKVSIVTIDNDKDPAVPKSFMEKNHYSFPVLVDDGWVSRSSGVSSFPTTWFVGADGKVAFEKKGASPRLVDEFTWRIEALKAGGH